MKSVGINRRKFLKRSLQAGAAVIGLSGLGGLVWHGPPPDVPRDPNYKLPEKAKFLPPEHRELLSDILSRIHPVSYEPKNEEMYKKSKRYANRASLWWSPGRSEGLSTRICKRFAIAATNLNYPLYQKDRNEKTMCPLGELTSIVNYDYSKDRGRFRQEFIELDNVRGIESESIDKLGCARGCREEAYIWLVRELIYGRVAEFNNKLKREYEDCSMMFKFAWEGEDGYLGSLKKALKHEQGNVIREGSYENTIKRIDDIFANLKHNPEKIDYRMLETDPETGKLVPAQLGRIITIDMGHKETKKMISEEERQQYIMYALDGIEHDYKTYPGDKISAYDNFANMMGGFNFMTDDPFLNQIMIFSVRQHIFEKAAEREKNLLSQGGIFIYNELFKEANKAEYIKRHYILLYEAEGKELPGFIRK